MRSDYDEIFREAFSEKIEVPTEYQQKLKETLKQAHITSPQEEQRPMNTFSRTGRQTENFPQKHKISVKTCLPLVACICACLALIIVLSVLLKQDSPGNSFNDTQYIKISATPAATENTVTADNSLRTEIPADTESPRRAQLPLTETTPALTAANTHVPKKERKDDTDAAQSKNSSKSGNRTTANHKKDATATPPKNHSPELAQVQASYTPETVETSQATTTPASIVSPKKTKTPENNTPQPTTSVTPNSVTMLPATAETPTETPGQASTMSGT